MIDGNQSMIINRMMPITPQKKPVSRNDVPNDHHEMHIKKRSNGAYQVQIIRNKKSYSKVAQNFPEALAVRRKLYAELGIVNPKMTRWNFSNCPKKRSLLPDGTTMETGISFGIRASRTEGRIEHSIQVNFKKKMSDKKYSTKSFYIGTFDEGDEPTSSQIWNTYANALRFRAAFIENQKIEPWREYDDHQPQQKCSHFND